MLPEETNHGPSGHFLDLFYIVVHLLDQFVEDVFFLESSQVSICACDTFGVLNGWVEVHSDFHGVF